MTTKNIRQLTFFLWLRRDVDELKLISDDKNYDEISLLTRRDGTKMLFEDYRTFKIHPRNRTDISDLSLSRTHATLLQSQHAIKYSSPMSIV